MHIKVGDKVVFSEVDEAPACGTVVKIDMHPRPPWMESDPNDIEVYVKWDDDDSDEEHSEIFYSHELDRLKNA